MALSWRYCLNLCGSIVSGLSRPRPSLGFRHMSMSEDMHLFENRSHVELYHKYRPTYPTGLITRIICYLERDRVKRVGLAVDVGCGSGQFTRSLASYFDKIIGVDVSEAQLASARKTLHPNIEYLIGSGESIPVPTASTDLITCAMSVNWFDFHKFCDEVQRILKPNGCVAIFGYEMQCCRFNGKKVEKLEKAFNELFLEKTKPYWTPNRKHVFNGYADLQLPFEDSERDDSFEIDQDMMLSDFIKCLQSLSFYQTCIKANPGQPDPALLFQQTALELLDVSTPAHLTSVTMCYPVFMVLARKPASK